jgi:hypothetical protein
MTLATIGGLRSFVFAPELQSMRSITSEARMTAGDISEGLT